MFKSLAKVAGNVLKTNAGKGAALFGAGAIAGSALDGGNSSSGSSGTMVVVVIIIKIIMECLVGPIQYQ